MSNNSRSFEQDFFTRRFLQVYDVLLALKEIRKRGVFATQLNLTQYNLSHIVAGARNFPVPGRPAATQVLKDDYGINPAYFEEEQPGEMFINGIRELAVLPTATTGKVSEVELLKQRIRDLETLVKQKDDVISALQMAIGAASVK